MIPMPPAVKLILALVLVGGIGAAEAIEKVEPAWTWLATLVQVATALELYFTIPTPNASKRVPPLVILALCSFCLVLVSGCLSSAPLVPVTPANATQISQCANTATMHDGIVVGDYVIGGLGATAGAVAAALPAADIGAKNGLAITGAAAAAVVAAGAGLASLTASQFAAQGCPNVVGPLVNKAAPQ